MNSPFTFRMLTLMAAVCLSAGCLSAAPPEVGEIQAQPSTTIPTGETASLTVPVSGTDPKFEWTVVRGGLSDPAQPSVIYTAPDSPGPDTVTVKVTSGGGSTIQSITFQVVAPTPTPLPTATNTPFPTNTPTPTDTPIPSDTPAPLECKHPSITGYVFPQLKDVAGQFPFYGADRLSPDVFKCQGDYGRYRSAPLAVKVEYHAASDENKAYFGIGTPAGTGYDVGDAGFTQICFWVYTEQLDQAFYLRMKDKQNRERQTRSPIIITTSNVWTEVCTALSEFSEQDVDLSQMENINLGFTQATGSAAIWVDDFEFK